MAQLYVTENLIPLNICYNGVCYNASSSTSQIPIIQERSFTINNLLNPVTEQDKLFLLKNFTPANIGIIITKVSEFNGKSDDERYTTLPPEDPEMFLQCCILDSMKWPASEIRYINDIPHYRALYKPAKLLLRGTVIFFTMGDGTVTDNLMNRFIIESQTPQEKQMFIKQMEVEVVHQHTYNMFAYMFEQHNLEQLKKDYENCPPIQAKIRFMEKYMGSMANKRTRLIAFICVERIIFPFHFLVPIFLQHLNLMLEFATLNGLINRDENRHGVCGEILWFREQAKPMELRDAIIGLTQTINEYDSVLKAWKNNKTSENFINALPEDLRNYAKENLSGLCEPMTRDEVMDIMYEVVDMCDNFTDFFFPEKFEGMFSEMTAQKNKNYLRVLVDGQLLRLGFSPEYNVENEYTWTDKMGGQKRNNFFERISNTYTMSNPSVEANWLGRITVTEDKKVNLVQESDRMDL